MSIGNRKFRLHNTRDVLMILVLTKFIKYYIIFVRAIARIIYFRRHKTMSTRFTEDERSFFKSLVSFKGNDTERAKMTRSYIEWAEAGFGLAVSSARYLAELANHPIVILAASNPKCANTILGKMEDKSKASDALALIFS